MRVINFKIEEKDEGTQIRTKLKHTPNGITKNGVFARAIDTVSAGDMLQISIEASGHMPSPTNMNVEICYEDEDVIVLNKPPFMPVHESRNHIGDTLSNFVSYHLQEDTAFRAVFRLDRDTSGLVLVAKNELSASKLAGQIKKDYYAVVMGIINEGNTVDLPIARCGDSIIKRRVDEAGERAVTHYEPVSVRDSNTLVKFQLETGRTHQIRVHMAHLGHPLLGDTLYGGDCSKISRQALHCKDIYFVHPVTGEDVHISSELPRDILEVI
jgi:23S rRNA pseudouridine1911/1915/1917 synthase